MCGVADLVQVLYQLIELALLQVDVHIEDMVLRCRSMQLPSTGNFHPRMLDVHVRSVPSSREWSGDDEGSEGQEQRPNHLERRKELTRVKEWSCGILVRFILFRLRLEERLHGQPHVASVFATTLGC